MLKKAISAQGGLDLRVSIDEVVTRSDLAIAALLSQDMAAAREYLAYTGAGRLAQAPFQTAVAMAPPPCGGPAGLRPDDAAIVEFNILPDGSVGMARPIYASVNGAAATEFARAVAGWSWRPDSVAKIPELFRAVTRVELRCSNSVPRPEATNILSFDLARWLEEKRVEPASAKTSDAADLALLKAELARREAVGPPVGAVPVLLRLGANEVAPFDERRAWLMRARDISAKAGAPLRGLIFLDLQAASASPLSENDAAERYRATLRGMLNGPGVAEDPAIAATVRLMIAEPLGRKKAPADAAELLRTIADDSRLSPGDPLRIGALVRLAALQAASGDLSAASESYRRTGIGAQQCALLDAPPRLVRSNADTGDFPQTAMAWGFEGWVRAEYDIDAEGRTTGQRAVIAYPPFVFRDAAIKLAKDLVYEKRFRPDGGTGCSAKQENINFRIPSLH